MIKTLRPLALAVSLALASIAAQAETVKIAFIDPLSGPFAPVGQNQLNVYLLKPGLRPLPYTGATAMRAAFVRPDGKPGPPPAQMQVIGPGHFADTAVQFDAKGTWTVQLTARLRGGGRSIAELQVEVR